MTVASVNLSSVELFQSKTAPVAYWFTDADAFIASLFLTVSKLDPAQNEVHMWQQVDVGDRFIVCSPFEPAKWASFEITSVLEGALKWEFGILCDRQGESFVLNDKAVFQLIKSASLDGVLSRILTNVNGDVLTDVNGNVMYI